MKSSKADPRKKTTADGPAAGKLLHDIEAISNALYLDKARSKDSVPNLSTRSKSVGKFVFEEPKLRKKVSNDESSQKDKKSIWNWKGLMGFTRNRRFNCCFSLEVHSIEGLPSSFDDLDLCVHWRRQNDGLVTHSARVFEGVAEFDDHLTLTCSVYGSRSGPGHSAKYEAKHFLLYAALQDAPELDLGKHRVDLTKFLPITLEELEDEKSCSKWTTSFKLSGMAKGASMNVSFGFSVVGSNNSTPPIPKKDSSGAYNSKRNNSNMIKTKVQTNQSEKKSMIHRTESLPARSPKSCSLEDIKDLHEVLPTARSDLAKSVSVLYHKLDEEQQDPEVDSPALDCKQNSNLVFCADSGVENGKSNYQNDELPSPEQDLQEAKLQVRSVEGHVDDACDSVIDNANDVCKVDDAIDMALEDDDKLQTELDQGGTRCDECNQKNDMCTTELLLNDLEMALHTVSETAIWVDSPEREGKSEKSVEENFTKMKSEYKTKRKAKSLCLDDVANSVADDFLNMLGIEHSPFGLSSESEPESPRERLLRQFEKDTLAAGCSMFDFDTEDGFEEEFEDFNIFLHGNVQDKELQLAAEADTSKPKASILENLETEALMREWNLDEKAFVESPPRSSVRFGSPFDVSLEEPSHLPPLEEGFGPILQTKNGGFLRSMDPTHFRNAKSGGSLVMQVSNPVVVPAEMGSGIMEILEHLASIGIEKLSVQANKLMPLDDVTGKTMQQVAWEAVPSLEASERQVSLKHDYEAQHAVAPGQKRGESSGIRSSKVDTDYVSVEDLAPLAMDKIEALSLEGLRIQSGMSDEDAPSNISPQTFGEISALEGKTVNLGGSLGLEGAGGLQLLDIKESGGDNDLDGLMSLSLTLDEWLRLDSGEIDDENGISERTSKILAAHHASDSIRDRSKVEKKRGKGFGKNCGLLGNNFTVALLVQLRDPLRDYESVGTPMLALIQVERLFVPPKPKVYNTVSVVSNKTEDEEDIVLNEKKEIVAEPKDEEGLAQFRITDVHVSGLKSESGKKKIWGSTAQQQSGSRWLLANGMSKGKKVPISKSKAVAKSVLPATVTSQSGDTLWSISTRVHGSGAKWKELAKLNPHIRNPNIIMPNEIIKLR